MSESVDVRMPDGTITTVNGAPDDNAARYRAYQDWQQRDAEGVRNWQRSLPLPGFGAAAGESFRGALGGQASGLGTVLEASGLPGAETARNVGDYIAGTSATAPQIPRTRQFEGFDDLLSQLYQRPWDTVRAAAGQAIGSVGGSVVAPAAAIAAGAMAGLSAPVVGGIGLTAGVLSGALGSASELETLLLSEGVPRDQAVGLAATVGSAIGAGEGGAATALLTRMLGRQVRRETADQLVRMAAQSRIRAGAAEAGAGLALEGGSEMAGSAARQATAALATGDPDLGRRMDQVLLDGAIGALGGGAAAGTMGLARPGRAQAELRERGLQADGTPVPQAPAPDPNAPPPEAQYISLPPAPEPFVDPAEAQTYLQSAAPETFSNIQATPEEMVTLANRYRQREHADEVNLLRQQELHTFLGHDNSQNPDASAQAQRFTRNIVSYAASNPEFDAGNFTPQEIANIALNRFGPTAEPPTKSELGEIRRQLNDLAKNGFLRPEGKGRYGFEPMAYNQMERQAAERRAEAESKANGTEAPPTQQQDTAKRTLDWLATGEYTTASNETLTHAINYMNGQKNALPPDVRSKMESIFGKTPDPYVAGHFTNLVETKQILDELTREERDNPNLNWNATLDMVFKGRKDKENPAPTKEQWADMDAAARYKAFRDSQIELAAEQARRIEYFQGYQQPAFRPEKPGSTVLEAGTPRNEFPQGPGHWTNPTPQQFFSGVSEAVTEEARQQNLRAVFANEDLARRMLEAVTQNLKPREMMTPAKWQTVLKPYVNVSLDDGKFIYQQARKLGIINPLGILNKRAEPEVKAPLPKVEQPIPLPPPKPEAKPKTEAKAEPKPKTEPKAKEAIPMPPVKRAESRQNAANPPATSTSPNVPLPPQGKPTFKSVSELGLAEAKARYGTEDSTKAQRLEFMKGFVFSGFYKNNKLPTTQTTGTFKEGFDAGKAWRTEIEAGRTPPAPPAPKVDLKKADGPFKQGMQHMATKNFDPKALNFGIGLLDQLGLGNKVRVFFIDQRDAAHLNFVENNNLTGKFHNFGQFSRPLWQQAMGGAVGLRSNEYAVLLNNTLPVERQMEALAHEIGHVFQFHAFNNAPLETQKAIMASFDKFYESNKNKSLQNWISATRTPYVAQHLLDGYPQAKTKKASEIDAYHRSFDEWFADNVARWSITADAPMTLVDRFFKTVADAYRRIVKAVGKKIMAPHQDVADFINKYREGQFIADPNAQQGTLDAGALTATAPVLPSDTRRAQKAVQQSMTDNITGFFKYFASPILTMGKVKPVLRPAAEQMQKMYTRTQEATVEGERLLAAPTSLGPESRAKITRLADQASRDRKAPDTSGLTEAEKKGLADLFAAGQKPLDYVIESAVMKHFTPNADMTQIEQDRLTNFWTKHEGKHLWEIPQKEVMAASPVGYREMQKLEKLRNPYYLPQMARGSHFVAAYKRKPNGERGDLVRMIAYEPRNRLMKLRGMPDTEQLAVEELRKEFPNDKAYVVMDRGVAFTKDAERAKIRDQANFVSNWFAKLNEASNKQNQRIIQEMMHDLDKAQIERLFRTNNNILRAVQPWNQESYIMDAMPQYILSMAKIQARMYTQDAWSRSIKNLSPNDQAFLNQLRDYSTTPTEAFGSARALSFFWYLGGALDTAVINLTQQLQTTIPMLTRDGGSVAAMREWGKAARQVMFIKKWGDAFKDSSSMVRETLKRVTDPDEAKAISRAFEEGVFNPIFTNESRGQFTAESISRLGIKNATGTAARMNQISNMAGSFMQVVETGNRATTFLAAYRMAKANPKVIERANKIDNTDLKTPYAYAMAKVFDTQFMTTKEDRAYVQRMHPLAEVATQFMSFPLKMIESYVRHAGMIYEGMAKHDPLLAKAGFVGLAGMVAPLIMLAGVWALPGAEQLRELLEKIASKIWGGTVNFDSELRELLGGGQMAEAVVRGVPHATGMMALSQRMKIDPLPMDDLSAMSVFGMLGPTGGLAEAWLSRVPQYYANGDYVNMAAALMPRALGNVVRGAGLEVTGEQRTLRGNRVITPDTLENHNAQHLIPHQAGAMQALGFPTPEFVNYREAVTRAEEIHRQMREPTERINQELAGYMTRYLDAQTRGDERTMSTAMDRFQNRVAEIMREQDGKPMDRQVRVNLEAIRTRAINDYLGIGSPEVTTRRAPRQMRQEVDENVRMLLWRQQPRQ